jgi:hypothetical protein
VTGSPGVQAWCDELRRAAGGSEVPLHVAVRLATLVDVTELDYLDVAVRDRGGHVDVELVALAGRTILTGRAQDSCDSNRPGATGTQLTARSLHEVRAVELRGADSHWAVTDDVRPGQHSVSITFLDGATALVPLSEIARPSVPGLLRKLVHGGLDPR